ncbi:hypothetical protein ACIQUB_11345 [Rhizobium sp. NPDC090275]|uniref:hypothetical protein n=1 Tax=Rhizobium sp. NPDC090275 TaxID=3364498 RepID=UPI0013AE957F
MSAIEESMRVYGFQSVNGGRGRQLLSGVFADFFRLGWPLDMFQLKPAPELAFSAF